MAAPKSERNDALWERLPRGEAYRFTPDDRALSAAVRRAKNAERNATAVALVDAGYTYGRAGALLDMSRNAVAGVVYRATRAGQ